MRDYDYDADIWEAQDMIEDDYDHEAAYVERQMDRFYEWLNEY